MAVKSHKPAYRSEYDRTIRDVGGVPHRQEYESRYDESGAFVSQGTSLHGPAGKQEVSKGTWTPETKASYDRLPEHMRSRS